MRDTRLLPSAAATWLVCGLGVGVGAGRLLVGAVLVVVPIAAVLLVAGRGGRRTRVASAWLVLASGALAAVACAAHLDARERGPLPGLVAERATVVVEGTVRSEPAPTRAGFDGGARLRFVVAVDRVRGRGHDAGAAARVLVLADEQPVSYGSRVRVSGRLAPTGAGDPARALLAASGAVELLQAPGTIDRAVARVRAALLEVTDPFPPDLRGLVPGAAVGDTSRVPADLDQAMRDVSLTHITAVSGGHFAVLSVTVLGAAGALGLPRILRGLVNATVMAGFVLLVHPEPSVVRAAAMGAVAVLGLVLGRPSRAVPALGAAVVVLLLVDPWLARTYGFALSVLATGAIALLAPVLAARLRRFLPRWLATAIAVPTAAQAVCAPVLVLLDPGLSLYAIPANLLAAPALVPATVLGVAGAVTAPVLPALAAVLLEGAGVAAWWIAVVARTAAGLPGARQGWPAGVGGAWLLAAATGVLLLLVLSRSRRWRRPGTALVCAALVLLVLARPPGAAWAPEAWVVAQCDVGQGDMLVVRSGEGAAVVVDVGPVDGGADACLDTLGVRRIDLLVLTHHHADHVGGLDAVLRGREVQQVLVGPVSRPPGAARLRAALERTGLPVIVGAVDGGARAGTAAAGRAGEIRWTVLHPPHVDTPGRADMTDTEINDAGLVLLLEGEVTVAALGDAETAAQERLATALAARGSPPVDVVKVAHHGSARQSERLARSLAPTVALIGVGPNDHGHPALSTVALYEATGAVVLATDRCGPIALGLLDDGVRVTAACLAGAADDGGA